MAESVHDQPTSLQYRLLLKRIVKLEGPIPAARALRVAQLQGLCDGVTANAVRAADHAPFERWPHP